MSGQSHDLSVRSASQKSWWTETVLLGGMTPDSSLLSEVQEPFLAYIVNDV